MRGISAYVSRRWFFCVFQKKKLLIFDEETGFGVIILVRWPRLAGETLRGKNAWNLVLYYKKGNQNDFLQKFVPKPGKLMPKRSEFVPKLVEFMPKSPELMPILF
ncbi:hypothetical protein [Bacillus sp. THAF10]|uniref:hypothetical protein n=1 Tax=Bacillus sp. THAF10 TaxID=2587848 RepID=UPI001267C02B|nr:hypothetical protein [Bacillus sp. THAF10]